MTLKEQKKESTLHYRLPAMQKCDSETDQSEKYIYTLALFHDFSGEQASTNVGYWLVRNSIMCVVFCE